MLLVERLKEGDVIYTNCSGYHLCYHLGIVYFDGKKKLIYHNDPNNCNRYGGNVCAETFDKFIYNRNVTKIVTTNVKNSDIIRVSRNCRSEVYNTLSFNCEDFVLEIVDGERRSNIRDAYRIAALGLTTLILL